MKKLLFIGLLFINSFAIAQSDFKCDPVIYKHLYYSKPLEIYYNDYSEYQGEYLNATINACHDGWVTIIHYSSKGKHESYIRDENIYEIRINY